MTPEGKVKETVKRVLRAFGVYWHMPVQNGMGAPTLDFICCVPYTVKPEDVGQTLGLYVAVETKAPKGKPTPRQEITIEQIQDASGVVFVIDGDTGKLQTWLKEANDD